MSFQEKSILCSDCGTTFTFTAEEQEFFAAKGFTNEPKRCPSCRLARKAQQGESNGNYRSDSNGYRPARQMFPVKCSDCGKDAQVPFEPRTGRPVYCSACYTKVKVAS